MREFGHLVGHTYATISRIETGDRKPPLDRIAEWADVLRLRGDDRATFLATAALANIPSDLHAAVMQHAERIARERRRERRRQRPQAEPSTGGADSEIVSDD